jgi:hypothetical protein
MIVHGDLLIADDEDTSGDHEPVGLPGAQVVWPLNPC